MQTDEISVDDAKAVVESEELVLLAYPDDDTGAQMSLVDSTDDSTDTDEMLVQMFSGLTGVPPEVLRSSELAGDLLTTEE